MKPRLSRRCRILEPMMMGDSSSTSDGSSSDRSDASSPAPDQSGWPALSGMGSRAFTDMSPVLAMDVDGAAVAAAPKSPLKEGAGWLGAGAGGLGGYDFGEDARKSPPAQPTSPAAPGC